MSENWIKAIVLVCTFGAVLLLVETLVSTIFSRRSAGKAINLRLRMIGQGRTRDETMTLLRRPSQFSEGAPAVFAPILKKLQRLAVAAQIRMPIGRLLLILVAAPAAMFFLIVFSIVAVGGAITFGRVVMIAAFAGLLGAFLPIMFLQLRASRTRKKMQEQFPVALDVFVRGLRAGHPIAAALDLLTVEMPDPIGSEFGMVVDEVTYGADLRDALQAMAERWDMDEMRMFVVSLAVQSETGGNLAEILQNLAKVIRERASMMMKVRALSSEGRMTGTMLTALPILAFVGLFIFNPAFYLEVADDPAFVTGFVCLALLYAIGFISIRRMIDLKV